MNTPIYLDANASVPVRQNAIERFVQVAKATGNPSSPHALGRRARQALDLARDQVAQSIAKNAHEIVFTSGASEGNRWLSDALLLFSRREKKKARVLMSPLEHPSLRNPLMNMAANDAIDLDVFSVTKAGKIEHEEKEYDAIFSTLAHNESGILLDLEPFKKRSPNTFFFTDGAQAWARIDVPDFCDAIVFSAHKIGAMSGAGAMWLSPKAMAMPSPWPGGGQEIGRRPGTEALALIAAMGEVAKDIERIKQEHRRLAIFRDRIENALVKKWGAEVLGQDAKRLTNTSALLIPKIDPDVLRMKLDRAKVCVGFGAACSALAPKPSPGLMALGVSAQDALRCVRISLPPEFNEELCSVSIERLEKAL